MQKELPPYCVEWRNTNLLFPISYEVSIDQRTYVFLLNIHWQEYQWDKLVVRLAQVLAVYTHIFLNTFETMYV